MAPVAGKLGSIHGSYFSSGPTSPPLPCPYWKYVDDRRIDWKSYRNTSLALGTAVPVIAFGFTLALNPIANTFISAFVSVLFLAFGFQYKYWHAVELFFRKMYRACAERAEKEKNGSDLTTLDEHVDHLRYSYLS